MDFIKRKEFLEKAEDYADWFIRKTRRHLPHIGRLCLMSTFLEDGVRLLTQFSDQSEYIASLWKTWNVIGSLFVLLNIATQFVGAGMVLLRYQVRIGVLILVSTVVLQTLGYSIFTSIFFLRNLSLCGSLLLMLAESHDEHTKSLMAGLPATGENAPQQYLLLVGRILVVLMFVTLKSVFSFNSLGQILSTLVCMAGVLMVAFGYKTKLVALLLVALLTLLNLYYNSFWRASFGGLMWDYLKYDFFQTWSIIGGLILIVAYGPGDVSVEHYKKKW